MSELGGEGARVPEILGRIETPGGLLAVVGAAPPLTVRREAGSLDAVRILHGEPVGGWLDA
jgi:hypothetical protein